MNKIKVGKHFIPFWLVVALLISGISSVVLASNIWPRVTIPFEVEEPIEILDYTSELSLFPGETKYINVTVYNHASFDYNMTLGFQLSDPMYQTLYVTFSEEIYTVVPGQQILTAWLMVDHGAPAITCSLTIDLMRVTENVEYVSIDELWGKPSFYMGYGIGFYIWMDVEGWHVWWTGDCYITGDFNVVAFKITTDGNFTDVQTYCWDWEDSLLINTNNELSGRSGFSTGVDGLDFNVTGATEVTFEIKISEGINHDIWFTLPHDEILEIILEADVHYNPQIIFLGENKINQNKLILTALL